MGFRVAAQALLAVRKHAMMPGALARGRGPGEIAAMASVEVETVKCACPDCVCVVPVAGAVTR
ncbi:MAG TPA: hypothetical protein VF641_08780, partial [Methylobacterium sp.]